MKTFKLLIIFFVFALSTNCVFADVCMGKSYLPEDKSTIEWKKSQADYPYHYAAHYKGKDGGQYLAHPNHCADAKKFFAHKIYEMFGLTPTSYLVSTSEIAPIDYYTTAIVKKFDASLKPLCGYSTKEREKFQEQLAKLHLVSSLITSKIMPNHDTQNCNIFVNDQKLYVIKDHAQFNTYDNDTGENFINKIEPLTHDYNNWHSAKFFQKPFQNYTLKHTQELIDWFENSWDENKIDSLYEELDLEDKELLTSLKLRFKNIKNKLQEIKENGYDLLTPEKLTKLLEEKLADDARVDFSTKNIPHTLMDKNYLPEVEDRMFICSDDEKTWLELTDFVYEESNNIIKLYLGDITDVEDLHPIRKDAIEIFDPETAFVFIRGVIGFWEDNSLDSRFHENDKTKNVDAKLAKAIQAGYEAVFYHFNFTDSLESHSGFPLETCGNDILTLQKSLHQKYAKEAKKIGRFVSPKEITRRKDQETQRLTAYYPNPIYLGNISKYIRLKDMSYNDYIGKYTTESSGDSYSSSNDKEIAKSPNIIFDRQDKFTPIWKKIVCPKTCQESDSLIFKRISVYAFRGESRPVDEIYKADGFWHRTNKEELENDSFWEINGGQTNFRCNYISTSSILGVAAPYGGYGSLHMGVNYNKGPHTVYTVFVDGGVKLPGSIRLVAAPYSITWENVVGARGIKNHTNNQSEKKPHLLGPVYLKSDLAENERENFWKILQIMGGKPQFRSYEKHLKIAKACINLLGNDSQKNRHAFYKIFVDPEKEPLSSIITYESYEHNYCVSSLENILNSESRIHRR